MINPDEIVVVKVTPKTAKHYISLGYDLGEPIHQKPPFWIINVCVKDLSKGSNVKVTRICDMCGKIDFVTFNNKQFTYCHKCASKVASNNKKNPDKFCIDCGKKISWISIRCRKCAKKFQSGENSPHWKLDKIRYCNILATVGGYYIGRYHSNTSYNTYGNIKDLMIFRKALTLDQIAAIMKETYIY